MLPGIATQWDVSADGLTWTFTIREGVKFHDGSDLTVQDVLWTLQHMIGPQAQEYIYSRTVAEISESMDRIELSGPDEVSVITKEPLTHLYNFVWDHQHRGILPKQDKLYDPEQVAAYEAKPIGAGPMWFVRHIPASKVELDRFDDYYYQPANGFPEDRRVKFQSLDLFLVPEEATRMAALRAGEADIVPASLAAKGQVEAAGGRFVFGPEGAALWPLMHGCYDPQYPCHDYRVFHALEYAVDKELMRDTLLGGQEGFELKGWAWISENTMGYTPQIDPFPFDPDKARQILADAGYPGGEGFGKLIVNTFVSTAIPNLVESAQLAADSWRRELGLDVEVRVGDGAEMKRAERAGEMDGQLSWRDVTTRRDPTRSMNAFYSDPENNLRMHYNPELFRAVSEAMAIIGTDQQIKAYEELMPWLREESSQIAIGTANIPWAVGPRVLTWQPYPMRFFPSALHTITLK
jgi:peptide/nickel transport system substrate-binding protein